MMQHPAFEFHRIPIGINNCFLLRGGTTILIDAGAPGHVKDFMHGMDRLGISLREIDLILLTHGHADHIGCLHQIQTLTDAEVAMHPADCAWVESGEPDLPRGVTPWGRILVGLGQVLYKPRIYPCPVDNAFPSTTSSLMNLGFAIPGQVVHTPGHSPGSISILLDSGEVFAGDMAMNAWFLRSTPGLPVLAEDMSLVIQSWKRLIGMGAKRVYPAHGADFPIEIIQKEIQAWERARGSKAGTHT